MLTTDLGRFIFAGKQWETVSRTADPVVPMHRVRASAFLDAELTLEANEAAAQLVEGGTRLVVMRRSVGTPLSVEVPDVGGVRASSLRIIAEMDDAWFVQGVGIAGDARLGVFLMRLAKNSMGAALVRGIGATELPAFSGSISVGEELWFLPDTVSYQQDAWVLKRGSWRREVPPTGLSVLLDAQVRLGALWIAYSDGIAVIRNDARAWYPLRVELAEPGWLCASSATDDELVQGRWVRGTELVGWGVGESTPAEDFPLDGSSCDFYTKASATKGLVSPLSVKITLAPAPGSELPRDR
jgi:hypothetical protein